MSKSRIRNRLRYVAVFLVPAAVAVFALAFLAIGLTPPPEPPSVSPRHKPRIKVVIDTSASMAGYFGGKTEFKDFLANFIATASQFASQTDYYFPGEAGKQFQRFDGDAQKLIADVLNNQLPQGTNSMLQEVVARLRDQISPGEVGVLITDGIFSYSNAEVAKNPEINRNNLRGLAAQVQVVFDRQSWIQRKISPIVSISQYSSAFQGTYYTYRNERLTACCGGPRPFYVWSFGTQPDVLTLVAALREEPRLKPQHEVLFGLNSVDTKGRILRYSNRTGWWVRNPENALHVEKVVMPTGDEPLRVTVALDLEGLPADTLTAAYVKANLKLDAGFAMVEPPTLLPRSAAQSQLNPSDGADLVGASHFLELRIKNLPTDSTNIAISLLDEHPAWTREFDTTDDSTTNLGGATPKTFGLLPILEGIGNALRSDQPLFRFEVVLER